MVEYYDPVVLCIITYTVRATSFWRVPRNTVEKKFENTVVGVEASATLMLLFLLESKFLGPRCISVGFSVDLRGFLGGSPRIAVDLRASRWISVAHEAISITYRL